MREKRIVVPDGMLKAATEQAGYLYGDLTVFVNGMTLDGVLAAALRWLSEHPMVPTIADIARLHSECRLTTAQRNDFLDQAVIVEWQRRMFFAPEPEVPQEAIDVFWAEYSGGVRGPESERRIEDGLRAVFAWQKANEK